MNHDRPYDRDLAYIHDRGFGSFARNSSPGLLEVCERAGVAGGCVVDLGCGSGIWARQLVDAGYRVVGVDISPAMVQLSRKRVPEARFHVGSFLDFELPPCQVVTALGEVLCYLFDPQNSTRALVRLLWRVFSALDPGGLLIFDVAEIGIQRNRPNSFATGDDWACLVEYDHNARRRQLVRHITTFRRIGKFYRRHQETHRQQLYNARQLTQSLRRIGFTVRTVRKYGDYPLLPQRVGFIARKPRR